MTLYRQISMLITIVFSILFFTILAVTFNIVKDSSQKELYQNAQNSVSTLSLSISNTSISDNNIQTMINATFDNGNYERITFKNINNEIKYQREQDEILTTNEVPLWFKNIIEIQIPTAKATLSSNWQIIGILEIINDKNIAYLQLYKVMINMFLYLSISCIVFLIVLYYVFHLILKPLLNIQKQANAVMNNEFIIQKELPKTKEFRVVIKSINLMVKKFESIFQTANESLSKNHEVLYMDNIMSISNRKYFILKAKEYLSEEGGKSRGTSIIISIKKVDLLNQMLGYENTNKFMHELAQYIKRVTKDFNDNLVCRLNGSEIIIMLPKIDLNKSFLMVEKIISYVNTLLERLEVENKEELGVSIGISEYKEMKEIGKLFSLVDYSLEQANLLPYGQYYTLINKDIAIGKNKWRKNLLNGLKNDKFEIIYRKVIEIETKKEVHNVVSFILKLDKNIYSYGEFIAPAVSLNLMEDVYLYIIEKVLFSKDCKSNMATTIQLPSEFFNNVNMYQKLKYLFERSKYHLKCKIIFEISETLVNKNYETILLFVKLFKEYDFNLGINNFIADSQDYFYLKELKPLFVKVDKQYILDTTQNINVLKIMLESLGIYLIVVGVDNIEEVTKLSSNNISVISGRIVDDLI